MKDRCCYNCKHLKNTNKCHKGFICTIDNEELDEFNLKIIECNFYKEKNFKNNI